MTEMNLSIKNIIISTILLFTVSSLLYSNPKSDNEGTASLSGYVKDEASGETLIGASVYLMGITGTKKGAYTNRNGFYTITGIPSGDYNVRVSSVGYEKKKFKISLKENEKIRKNINIKTIDVTTDNVIVIAEREIEKREITVSKVNIPIEQIKQIRIGGEADVFRALQYLPGVLTSSQISSGLYIRGGSPDQNLVLLDGATVYNPTHLFGFVSSFNPEAIKDVEIIKGGYPAEYGSRLSSVLNITQKDGNRNEFQGLGSIGLISSKLSVEGPVGNGSFFLGGRRTYFDLLMPLIDTDPTSPVPDFMFYDINAKITQDITEDDKISFSGFIGNDDLDLGVPGMNFNMFMENMTGSGKWTHIFSENLFLETVLSSSFYESGLNQNISNFIIYIKNSITDYSLKSQLEWLSTDKLTVKTGFEIHNYIFAYEQNFSGDGQTPKTGTNEAGNVNLLEPDWTYDAFGQVNYQVSELFSFQTGLRVNYWDVSDNLTFDPRLGLRYRFSEDYVLKATWGIYHQYLRLASIENFSIFDTWLPTDNTVEPSRAIHYILSLEATPFEDYEFNFDLYYKSLQNISEHNMTQLEGNSVADYFFNGYGEAFGFEVFLQKKIGKFSGWIGYAFGFVNTRFDSVNFGKWFRPRYDRRHDLKFVISYELNKDWDFGATFMFQSGQPYTAVTSRHQIVQRGMSFGIPQVIESDRYALRLPASHQLNISGSYHFTMLSLDSRVILDIFNVYNRRDILFRYFNAREESGEWEDAKLLPIIPTLSFEVKF